MGKLKNYVLIFSGLMLLFYFTGLIPNTPTATMLNMLLDITGFANNLLYLKVIAVISMIGLAVSVVLGFLNINQELAVSTAFCIFMFNLLWDIISVVSAIASVNRVLAVLFFSPILLVYIITLFEFWRGRDY
jgi:hypothetical protein